eukprot:CAMPEP_0174378870 /NCGR_PEP_ID=MMETSP0811_2-20130205/122327_1 /TAXON_ID=73025 ORGANISM="Eutreptiella gymnastica-like, Strain CCMP1594" /NCGR_SAMPLE_ID=MMETSP0811_2 /ASSEMBLY_ACC=CAM_ASM_000667 /LENGTH=45 /DNA_ID= /DNA_START= /DNA_END= /DNA_ORIENTATION=
MDCGYVSPAVSSHARGKGVSGGCTPTGGLVSAQAVHHQPEGACNK